MAEKAVEIWTEINLMELTLKGGTMTFDFEELVPDMQGETDRKLLAQIEQLCVKTPSLQKMAD